ncbi:MAG: MotA/TolQ/ExbB proton channel family protein [Kiritimatiellia bacterium]|nr:MotA/TolQ/ExbB proton channel family protein [Lentisphaerota bacterium]
MWAIMTRGGPLMWPLLSCSLVAVTVIAERTLFWMRLLYRRDRTLIDRIFALSEAGDFETAQQAASDSRCVTARVLAAGLQHYRYGLRECLEAAADGEIEQMKRGLNVLDTIITLAPLLGILGTVAGIIQSFDLLGQAGMESPQAVTGGIGQALITTAAGLTVAIITLLPYNALVHRTEKFARQLEKICTHFEVTVRQGRQTGANRSE